MSGARPAGEGWQRTRHGWARPCAACWSVNYGSPCRLTRRGFHVAYHTPWAAEPQFTGPTNPRDRAGKLTNGERRSNA